MVFLPWLQKIERNNFSYFVVFGIKLPNGSNLGNIYIVPYTLLFVKMYFCLNMSLFAKSHMAADMVVMVIRVRNILSYSIIFFVFFSDKQTNKQTKQTNKQTKVIN